MVDKSDSSRDTEGHAAIPGAAHSRELGLTPTKRWGRSSAAGRGGSTPRVGLGREIPALSDSGDQPRTTTRCDTGCDTPCAPNTYPLLPRRWPRGAGMWPPSRGPAGSALPTAPHLLKRSLAAKDTHVCIKLLGSQSNSGTSDSNYRCITGADKSAARQPGTCQCSAADAVRGAERGEGLRLLPPIPGAAPGCPGHPQPHHGPPVPHHPGVSTPQPCSEAAPAPAGLGTRLSLGRGTSSCPSLPQRSLCSLWGGLVPKTAAGSWPDPCSAWPGCPGQPPVLLQQSENQRREHPQLPAAAREPRYSSSPGGARRGRSGEAAGLLVLEARGRCM